MKMLFGWIAAAACAMIATPASAQQSQTVRHVVVFKYKPTATAAQITEITMAFRALKDTSPGILSF